jgi:hypothetical protein
MFSDWSSERRSLAAARSRDGVHRDSDDETPGARGPLVPAFRWPLLRILLPLYVKIDTGGRTILDNLLALKQHFEF